MDRSRFLLFLHTIKYLQYKQIYYQLYYLIHKKLFNKNHKNPIKKNVQPLKGNNRLFHHQSFTNNNTFTFLNITHQFKDKIDWNFSGYGKLWTYNLNYFDFLNQEQLTVNIGIGLINDYIKNDTGLKDGKEPYPISLRGINWIKFLSKNNILNNEINQKLYNHYQILSNNIEYHLLGNHLLENGFSMLFGAYYFQDDTFYKKAKKILLEELEEQVLSDGAHFELSPMYHQILLHRLLDCINLVSNNTWKQEQLLFFFKEKALKMLSWLQIVTYKNGNIPMVNDSAYGIAPTSEQLFLYAKSLGIQWEVNRLSDSGYRKYENKHYELFMDVGNVGPTYQPGHAHSDTFNFEFYVNEKPIIVDTGISTYEKNSKRQLERSTISHNTVKIGNYEQTQVWDGFRVAQRAVISSLNEKEGYIEATHNGYKKLNVMHTRKFISGNKSVVIQDTLSIKAKDYTRAYLHLHPNIKKIEKKHNTINLIDENIQIDFSEEAYKINILEYDFSIGFNKTVKAKKIEVFFNTTLETQIFIKS